MPFVFKTLSLRGRPLPEAISRDIGRLLRRDFGAWRFKPALLAMRKIEQESGRQKGTMFIEYSQKEQLWTFKTI
jgi:hypothetical protein